MNSYGDKKSSHLTHSHCSAVDTICVCRGQGRYHRSFRRKVIVKPTCKIGVTKSVCCLTVTKYMLWCFFNISYISDKISCRSSFKFSFCDKYFSRGSSTACFVQHLTLLQFNKIYLSRKSDSSLKFRYQWEKLDFSLNLKNQRVLIYLQIFLFIGNGLL